MVNTGTPLGSRGNAAACAAVAEVQGAVSIQFDGLIGINCKLMSVQAEVDRLVDIEGVAQFHIRRQIIVSSVFQHIPISAVRHITAVCQIAAAVVQRRVYQRVMSGMAVTIAAADRVAVVGRIGFDFHRKGCTSRNGNRLLTFNSVYHGILQIFKVIF